MIFPFEIPFDEMDVHMKEWEILGFDVQQHAGKRVRGRLGPSDPHISIYKPVRDEPRYPGVPMYRSWTSYSIVDDMWVRSTPDPEELYREVS